MKQKDWKTVNKRDPCEICGHDDWCRRSFDGCHECHRISIDVPGFKIMQVTLSGFGLHRPDDPAGRPQYHQRAARPVTKKPDIPEESKDWGDFAFECTTRMRRPQWDAITKTLGVTAKSLLALNVGMTSNGTWTFPMWDLYKITGIRTRTPDGQKRAVKGSKQGVFKPITLDPRETSPFVICEGPTDTAAFLDLGFWAVGRPSNMGGQDILAQLVPGFHVVICYDNDPPESDARRNTQKGTEILIQAIRKKCESVRAIHPPFVKDARDWIRQGATREQVLEVIENARAV